jgi:hypothetical protein
MVLVAGIAGLAALEYRCGYLTGYHLEGLGMVRSPSLFLDVKQALGLQRFYSQMGQDKWIIGKVFPGVRNGFFVDIGSGDAEDDSNSKALELLGWKGICVDPLPPNWYRRRCTLYRVPVYSKKGEIVRFRDAGHLGGIDEHIDRYRKVVDGLPVVEFTTTTIADILENAQAPPFIHYVSLDIEGAEYEALKAFPFSKHTVGAFTIEHNYEEPKRTQIRELLARHGYRLVREHLVEDWYVGPEVH